MNVAHQFSTPGTKKFPQRRVGSNDDLFKSAKNVLPMQSNQSTFVGKNNLLLSRNEKPYAKTSTALEHSRASERE